LLLVSLLSVWVLPRSASAGGLYLMPRGVEAAARGGARVAGADDPQALWYNPAGLLSSGRQLLIDTLLPIVRTDFTRVLDSGEVEPTVKSNSYIPIPTIAYSDNFGLKRWGFGAGLLIPTAYGGPWPTTVNGQPAPTRYSALTDGSSTSYMASLALGAAYSPIDRLSIGMAVYLTVAQVSGDVAISACDYAVCLEPEAPEWEGRARFVLGPLVTGTAVLGTTYAFDKVKLGGSFQFKTRIGGDAKFDVSLPDQAVFDDVVIENKDGSKDLKAHLQSSLPMIARAGVEVQPIQPLKVELAMNWENWSDQSSVTVQPKNVILRNVPGVGDAAADPVTLARHAHDTWALNLGGIYDLAPHLRSHRGLTASMGFMYESSSVQPRDLSVSSMDTRKYLIGFGVGVAVTRKVFIDVTYGHIFMQDYNVTNSRVLLPAATKPLPVDNDPNRFAAGDRPAIGNGKYNMEADFVGVGVRWKLDPWRSEPAPAAAPAEVPLPPPVVAPVPAIEPLPEPAPIEPPPAPAPVEPAPAPASIEPAPAPASIEPAPAPIEPAAPAAPAPIAPTTP
jgi:long-chain fatty acid transport protein